MSALGEHLDRYLRLRRSLGYKLQNQGRALASFVAFLDDGGEQTLSVRNALAWASLADGDANAARRLSAVRGFATYLCGFDAATQIPPARLLPSKADRLTPYLFSNTQLGVVLAAAGRLRPESWGATMATFIGLLAATGMRPGEAYRLDRAHVDLAVGELFVLESKFDKSRVLPLHHTTVAALGCYTGWRDAAVPAGEEAFFLDRGGQSRLRSAQAAPAFKELLAQLGITAPAGRRPPRLYDLRHSFAVQTLIDWHRSQVDVQRRLPVLSAYLGHLVPANTYWYLQASPELLAVVAERVAASFEERP